MITFAETVTQLHAIADERSDYIYRPSGADRMCRYADLLPGVGLVPGCLLGHWLHRFHRIDLNRLSGFTGYNIERVLPDLIHFGLVDEPDDRLRMVRFLGLLQELQDAEVPWGRALREALAKIQQALPLPEPVVA